MFVAVVGDRDAEVAAADEVATSVAVAEAVVAADDVAIAVAVADAVVAADVAAESDLSAPPDILASESGSADAGSVIPVSH